MKNHVPTQLIVGLGILLVGAGIVVGEFLIVRWYPGHQIAVRQQTLDLVPFKNDGLGIEMQVAKGITEKVEPFSGGVRIYAPRVWGIGPTIKITSQPNPDNSSQFSPQITAVWQTDGVTHDLPRYHFEHTEINHRDAVLIWQYKDRSMVLTMRVIAPDRIVEAECNAGATDEDLYMLACDESFRTIKVAGPESVIPATPGVYEIPPNEAKPAKKR
jgi:hypothetical protein